ncbi:MULTISPECIES: helix-turn-helix transcriptional regulator [unclassified Streptomyces]|uniref:helix-turn-helix transcriptional regulator n=1 Tax=unclassified Streptomyces TaxID=2593676 RepID=UPI00064CEFCB|nr:MULTISPECIES: helix-turn-helix transcriptional regulator [unclassified Streptomyces]
MPNRRRAIDPSHPLGRFARQLRELQASARARAGSSDRAREISIDKVAVNGTPWSTSRTAIYAALNGTRLASPDTLCAIVTAWDHRGGDGITEWLRIRDQVEEDLIKLRSSTTPMATPSGRSESDLVRLGTPTPHRALAPSRGRLHNAAALKELKRRLQDARAKGGLSMTQVAARGGLARTTLHMAFNGDGVPSAATVASLARVLKLDQEDLLRMRAAVLAE